MTIILGVIWVLDLVVNKAMVKKVLEKELEHRLWDEYIGKFVKEHRNKRGLTLNQMAKASGLNRCSVMHIEKNNYSPIFRNVTAIFQVLDLSIEDFSNYLKKQNRH